MLRLVLVRLQQAWHRLINRGLGGPGPLALARGAGGGIGDWRPALEMINDRHLALMRCPSPLLEMPNSANGHNAKTCDRNKDRTLPRTFKL